MLAWRGIQYTAANDEDKGNENEWSGYGGDPSSATPSLTFRWHILPWIVSTLAFATISLGLVLRRNVPTPLGNFESGFTTEIDLARSSIEVHQVRFRAGLVFDDNGVLHRTFDPDQPQYVGSPSPAIDEAWDTLIKGRYISFTEDEAKKMDVKMHRDAETGLYRAGADSLHTLHCINKLRMAIDKDYYHDELGEPPRNYRLHVEHCTDYLRQIVQCSADFTPLPIIWMASANETHPDYEQVHTCRNFKKLRSWATNKQTQTLATTKNGMS